MTTAISRHWKRPVKKENGSKLKTEKESKMNTTTAVFYGDAEGEVTMTVGGEDIPNPWEHVEELLEEEDEKEK